MKIYVTFGQVHTHSVEGKTFDKDCVAVINAPNETIGRDKAFEYFDKYFFTTYTKQPDMQYFPRGLIEVNP